MNSIQSLTVEEIMKQALETERVDLLEEGEEEEEDLMNSEDVDNIKIDSSSRNIDNSSNAFAPWAKNPRATGEKTRCNIYWVEADAALEAGLNGEEDMIRIRVCGQAFLLQYVFKLL